MFRDVLAKTCRDAGHEIVGEASSGSEALGCCERTAPDLLVLDLQLPEMDGLTVMHLLARAQRRPQVLVVSVHVTDFVAYSVERSIARGFIDKNIHTRSALVEAIDAVAQGKTWFSPTFLEANLQRKRNPKSFDKVLTSSEQNLLRLAARGAGDAEIADRLRISTRTCEGHRSRALRKLGLANSLKLVVYARDKGFDLFATVFFGSRQ